MITCPFCCLHCDDLRVELRGGRITRVLPHCERAEQGYRQSLVESQLSSSANLKDADALLRRARNPLVVLGGAADQEAVGAAIQFAQRLSGTLINGDGGAAEELAVGMSRVGVLQATLGELRSQTDLVVVCGSDPVLIAPRIWESCGGEKKRINLTWEGVDPIHAIRWLRLALRGQNQSIPPGYRRIAEKIQAAEQGLFLIGEEQLGRTHSLALELLKYSAELNRHARWYCLFLSTGANTLGVAETMLSQVGSNGSMRFNNGQPIVMPRAVRVESAAALAGAILFVGSIPPAWRTRSAQAEKPIVVLSAYPPDLPEAIWIPVAQPGVDGRSSMLRLDGLPVELEPLITSQHLTSAQALDRLCQEVVE